MTHSGTDPDLLFDGKTVLVTGSGRNIGRAIAVEFGRRGANVIVNSRSNWAEAESIAREIEAFGSKSLVVLGDVSDPEVVSSIASRAIDTFGRVDIYVSNAARRLHKDFFETTDEDWHRHLNMQLTASWYLAKAFVPGMKEAGWGRIVHVNGPDGWSGGVHRIPHSTAKGGLRTLTKGLAYELGPYGITVNDVVPGFTDTIRDPVTHPNHLETRDAKISETPIRRQIYPEELAWACIVLCAERSAAITGTALHVNGGKHMIG